MVAANEYCRGEEDYPLINLLQDSYPRDGDDDEAEETLSLSDLPIYSDESNCDDYYYSKQDQKKSDSLDNEDSFFEFFNNEFSFNSTYSESDDIIFCGKLIPYKQSSTSTNTEKIKLEQDSSENFQIKSKSQSFNIGKLPSIDCKFDSLRSRGGKTSKSFWFWFMFGSASFHKEMELGNMRTRQRRSYRPLIFRSSEEREMVKGRSEKKTRNGLWKLLRTLVMDRRSSDKTIPLL